MCELKALWFTTSHVGREITVGFLCCTTSLKTDQQDYHLHLKYRTYIINASRLLYAKQVQLMLQFLCAPQMHKTNTVITGGCRTEWQRSAQMIIFGNDQVKSAECGPTFAFASAPEDVLMWASTQEAVLSKVVISRLGNYKKEEDSLN